jgi:hypothetical protein
MGCQANQPGRITNTSRETLRAGKVTLTTAATTNIAQPAFAVTGAFSVTSAIALNALNNLKVGGLTYLGTSGAMSFGAGSYALAGGLQAGGSTAASFGAGTFNIGRMAAACNGAQFSICSSAASLNFSGSSTFQLNSEFYVGGGSTVVLGAGGTDNSY